MTLVRQMLSLAALMVRVWPVSDSYRANDGGHGQWRARRDRGTDEVRSRSGVVRSCGIWCNASCRTSRAAVRFRTRQRGHWSDCAAV